MMREAVKMVAMFVFIVPVLSMKTSGESGGFEAEKADAHADYAREVASVHWQVQQQQQQIAMQQMTLPFALKYSPCTSRKSNTLPFALSYLPCTSRKSKALPFALSYLPCT